MHHERSFLAFELGGVPGRGLDGEVAEGKLGGLFSDRAFTFEDIFEKVSLLPNPLFVQVNEDIV